MIAIDCDDVLIPTATAIIDDYNNRFDASVELLDFYKVNDTERWNVSSKDEAMERVNAFLYSDAHAYIAPYPEAVAAVQTLAEKYELHLVTGRASFLETATKDMLDTHFKGCFQTIEHTNFMVSSKDTLAIKRSKGEVCQAIRADVLIDDHIVHGESVLQAGVERVIVFGDYPWNQSQSLSSGMVRCANWQATTEEIEKIAKG